MQDLFEIRDNTLIRYYGSDAHVVIPDGITTIGDKAFYNNQHLVSIVIPDSVSRIKSTAFAYCTRLTSVTIPDSVTVTCPQNSAVWAFCIGNGIPVKPLSPNSLDPQV